MWVRRSRAVPAVRALINCVNGVNCGRGPSGAGGADPAWRRGGCREPPAVIVPQHANEAGRGANGGRPRAAAAHARREAETGRGPPRAPPSAGALTSPQHARRRWRRRRAEGRGGGAGGSDRAPRAAGSEPGGSPESSAGSGELARPPSGGGEGGAEGGGAAGEPGREGQREGQREEQRGRVNRGRGRRDEAPRRAGLGAAAAARAGGQGKEGWRPAAGARRAGGGCAGGSPRSWRSAAGRPTPCSRCSPTAGWWRGRSWAACRRRTPATTAW